MEGMCGFHSMDDYSDKALMSPECLIVMPTDHYTDQSLIFSGDHRRNISLLGSDDHLERGSGTFQCFDISESTSIAPEIHSQRNRRVQRLEEDEYDEDTCKAIKAKIASHPSYRKLLDAYIDCQKVGAPPEIACLLDEIKQESGFCPQEDAVASACLGADPELDEFMETYCDILVKYKSDLERSFGEATAFLNKMQMQLGKLGKDCR